MTALHDERTEAALQELLQANGWDAETRLYRYTLPEFLDPEGESGACRISSNPEPSEAVADVYGPGHLLTAEQVAPGLAFAESADNEWKAEDRVCVEVRLKDLLDQGGLIYPVESIITDRVWYVTFPRGRVRVRIVPDGSGG